MKLTGSLTEQVLREELLNANIVTLDSYEAKKIFLYLTQLFSEVTSAYTLHWVFEQDIEVLKILVNGDFIATIEIDRSDYSGRVVEKVPINKYKIGLKKKDQLKLLIALDLAEKYKG